MKHVSIKWIPEQDASVSAASVAAESARLQQEVPVLHPLVGSSSRETEGPFHGRYP